MVKNKVINILFLFILYLVVWGSPLVAHSERTLNDNMYVSFSTLDEGYVLDVSGSTGKLITYPYHGLGNQLLSFKYRPEKDGYIIQLSADEQRILTLGSNNQVSSITVEKVINSLSILEDEVIWDIKKVSGNIYSISNRKNGLYITVDNVTSMLPISMKANNNSNSQKFKLETMQGVYTIENRWNTNMVWDIEGGVYKDRDIIGYPSGGVGKKNQEWFLLYKPNNNQYVLSNSGDKRLIVDQKNVTSSPSTMLNNLAFNEKYANKNLLSLSKITSLNGNMVVTIRNWESGLYYELTDIKTYDTIGRVIKLAENSESTKQQWILKKKKELAIPTIDNIKVMGTISGESTTFYAGEKLTVNGRYTDSEFKQFDLYAQFDTDAAKLIEQNIPINNGTQNFSAQVDTSDYRDGEHFVEFSARGDGMFQSNRVALKYQIVYPTPVGKPKPQVIEQYTDINSLNAGDFVTDLRDEIGSNIEITGLELDTSLKGDQIAVVSIKNKYKTVKIDVPVTILPNPIITSDYFENQAWLIDEINRQFSTKGKKIDENLYMLDLLDITSIVNRAGADFPNQHIPKNIEALQNLQVIDLKDKHLSGSLPDELGNLTNLKKLSIFGNSFTGEIPKTISKLEKLEFLALDDNKLTGTVPPGLEKLTKLKQVYINKNALVGILPTFNLGPFYNFSIRDTQLTYNEKNSPSFISNETQYQQTFAVGKNSLALTGVKSFLISDDGAIIKPFDSTNEGFLNLRAQKKDMTDVELYSGHTFKIINKENNQVLYDGQAIKNTEIKIDSDTIYQVVMDNAEKNPNNITEFEAKLREYTLSEVPKTLSLDLTLGDFRHQPVKISSKDSLSVFDNRLNSQWQLKIKPSELKSQTRTMTGSYFYKSNDGVPVEILTGGSFTTIESGTSKPNTGTIDISKEWNDESGLFYKQSTNGNYKDTYTGKIEWQLVDAPAG
ncbi:hypothetical protein A5821_001264 [Enterococcus sp. 7F3_DIV0205]|uniref:Ricin B lectin domain-containing protein n=1 Tax=Candidatus Enterococcus palustris TaxID=1834189 RepID=A0AAQ3Y4S1_9ENTE|nr:RICIN domain-containing protein [Enterococcus sp. 7F3_DIV0205]OTN85662.1 hypothetical protein A5821_001608 [Enterococcus sp. 7F3_DIV0205]